MRTIKFRGKTNDGEWVYGYYIPSIYEDVDIITVLEFFNLKHKNYAVLKETVGQFTGLFDKNNREIYEGDIVKYTRYKVRSEYFKKDFIENVYVVYWNEEKHAFYCTTKFESGGGASGYLDFHDERAEKEEIEVIGNIHDNPELLEGGNNE